MDAWLYVLGSLAVVAGAAAASSLRVVKQIERGVVFRLGRAQRQLRPPGLTTLIPVVDRMKRVNVQVVTMPVPAQDRTRTATSVTYFATPYVDPPIVPETCVP